ncbi:hypothetical protein D3C83_63870 [compost metagenome]
MIADDLDDRFFGHMVDARDKVIAALFGHFEFVYPAELAQHHLAGTARGANRYVDHPVHEAVQRRILGGRRQT